MLLNKINHDLLIFFNKLTISFNSFVFFLLFFLSLYSDVIMIFRTFNIVMFKSCFHGDELIDLYWNCAWLTQVIINCHSYRFSFQKSNHFCERFQGRLKEFGLGGGDFFQRHGVWGPRGWGPRKLLNFSDFRSEI